jgi:hypothetical protein
MQKLGAAELAAKVAAIRAGEAPPDSAARDRMLAELAEKPLEITQDWGSTSGAASGDFAVYRWHKAKELKRIAALKREDDAKAALAVFDAQERENETAEDRARAKRRKKRLARKAAQKLAKKQQKVLKKTGFADDGSFMAKAQAILAAQAAQEATAAEEPTIETTPTTSATEVVAATDAVDTGVVVKKRKLNE